MVMNMVMVMLIVMVMNMVMVVMAIKCVFPLLASPTHSPHLLSMGVVALRRSWSHASVND